MGEIGSGTVPGNYGQSIILILIDETCIVSFEGISI